MSESATGNASGVAAFRNLQANEPVVAYEYLSDADRTGDAVKILNEGWSRKGYPSISVNPPIKWNEAAASNRSWEFLLHSWEFLGPALCALDEDDNGLLLEFAVSVAVDWAEAHPSLDVQSRMAWYDMAVGLRAYRLAFIVDLAARSPNFADSTVETLLGCVDIHQLAFTQESIFKAHSNHGLYVAAGQKAMSRRLALLQGMDDQRSMSDARLRQMMASQFTREGVHTEHSPDYHRMILSTMKNLDSAGLLPSDTSVDIQAIEEALAWFVLPDRSFTMFGDTPWRKLAARDNYTSPVLQYSASGSRSGRPPRSAWRSFPQSGYAVYRSGWPAPSDDPADWSYLAMNAAFHSRTHKHADDLSFIWYDRGSHILVDPGRYGYLDPTDPNSDLGERGFYYADPNRIYVEETRAHNAVDIDGQSYQRRGVRPYGSAIRRAGESQGIFYAEAHTEHLTLDRSFRVQHSRVVVLRAREWLIVYDRLWDPRNRPHEFRQWFQFAPHLEVEADDIGWSITGPEGSRLWGVPLLEGTRSAVMRGVSDPELQGWISYHDHEIEPTFSACLTATGMSVSFGTLFCFSKIPPVPKQSIADNDRVSLSWSTSARSDLTIDLSQGEIDLAFAMGRH